jgi:hypothetical protein
VGHSCRQMRLTDLDNFVSLLFGTGSILVCRRILVMILSKTSVTSDSCLKTETATISKVACIMDRFRYDTLFS